MRHPTLIGLLLVLALLAATASGQTEQQRQVVASGGATIGGANSSIVGTVGQPAIGKLTGTNTWHFAGFLVPLGEGATAVPDLPTTYRLRQNYPNPFNPATTICFDLPETRRVRLDIYGLDGRRVAVLLDEVVQAGYREVRWQGEDNHGRQVASGAYFYRIRAGDFEATERMMLVK